MRTTIAWSYDLLSDSQKAVFRKLAVFQGGAEIQAIELIINSSSDSNVRTDIEVLLDHNLLYVVEDADIPPRFTMFQVIHEYAQESLQTGPEERTTRDHHLEYYSGLARQNLNADDYWPSRFDPEVGNFRAALDHAIKTDLAQEATEITLFLSGFWLAGFPHRESTKYIERALGYGSIIDKRSLAALHRIAGVIAMRQEDGVQARRHLEARLQISKDEGDVGMRVTSLMDLARLAASLEDDLPRAQWYIEENIKFNQTAKDKIRVAQLLADLGEVMAKRGQLVLARSHFEASLAGWQEIRNAEQYLYTICRFSTALRPLMQERNLTKDVGYKTRSFIKIFDPVDYVRAIRYVAHQAVLGSNLVHAAQICTGAEAYRIKKNIHASKVIISGESTLRHAKDVLGSDIWLREEANAQGMNLGQTLSLVVLPWIAYGDSIVELGDREGVSKPESLLEGGPLHTKDRDILRLLALGMSSPQISDELISTSRDIDNRIAKMMRLLGYTSRLNLVALAAQHFPIREPQQQASKSTNIPEIS